MSTFKNISILWWARPTLRLIKNKMMMNSKFIRQVSLAILLALALWQWSQAGMIASKAYLAKWLIAQAWQQTLTTGENTKPWPWADTWPVAKITFADKKSFYILAGSAGNSLAFGPGHVSDTALPGTEGTSVIGGHRDTHFSNLKSSNKNDSIHIQNKQGKIISYTIQESWIANSQKQPLIINQNENSLYLITCYPFDSLIARGSERFVVKAEPMHL